MIKLVSLLILGISLASSYGDDFFIGEPNQELSFNITTAGYYIVNLEGSLFFDIHYEGGVWQGNISTMIDSALVVAPAISAISNLSNQNNSSLCYFDVGNHTISGVYSVTGIHKERASIESSSSWLYSIKPAQDIDYRGDMQQLKEGVANLKSEVTNLDSSNTNSIEEQNKKLEDINSSLSKTKSAVLASNADMKTSLLEQIDALQEQSNQIHTTLSSLSKIDEHITHVDTDVSAADTHISDLTHLSKDINNNITGASTTATQNTASILSAIDGLSQQIDTVNNNVVTGNKNNQTLGIIGISLGATGIGAAVGMPFLMQGDTNSSTDVNFSPSSDSDNINYISPGGKND